MFIDKAQCEMGKYSNNIELHGEEHVQSWTIPIVGVLLYAHQLEVLLHDPRGSEAFFGKSAKDGALEPRPWTTYADPIHLTEAYDGMAIEMKLGDEVVTFERCRLKDITLGRFMQGGVTQVDLKLQIAPGLDRENLLLQEYQHERIVLTVESAKVALKKKSKQTDWLTQAAPPEQADVGEPDATDGDNHGDGVASEDALYADAVTFVRESRITTISALMSQFHIGYNRAALLLGAMQIAGVVGPQLEDGSRAILDAAPAEPARGPGDDDDGDGVDEAEEIVPLSPVGRAVTAHAKRQARKRGRPRKNGEARAH